MSANFSPNIFVTDVTRSLDFLTAAVGFKETMRMGPEGGAPVWAALERDGHRVMIEAANGHAGKLGATVDFYVSVDSLEAEIARLRASGVAFSGPEQKPYGMREVSFKDPDGYSWTAGERTVK